MSSAGKSEGSPTRRSLGSASAPGLYTLVGLCIGIIGVYIGVTGYILGLLSPDLFFCLVFRVLAFWVPGLRIKGTPNAGKSNGKQKRTVKWKLGLFRAIFVRGI